MTTLTFLASFYIVEPARLLTAHQPEDRVSAAFACPLADHLAIPREVS